MENGNGEKQPMEQRFSATGEPIPVALKNPNAIAFYDEEFSVDQIEELILNDPKIQKYMEMNPTDGIVHRKALEIFKEIHTALQEHIVNAKKI